MKFLYGHLIQLLLSGLLKLELVLHSFLWPPLNSLKRGRLNIYTSALACLMLKAHSHSRVNEWKSFRQNTSSGWWVPGHFTAPVPQVQPPFQGMRDSDPGVCSGAQWRSTALLTLLSLWKEAICAFRVGSGPKRLYGCGLEYHVRALRTKTTSPSDQLRAYHSPSQKNEVYKGTYGLVFSVFINWPLNLSLQQWLSNHSSAA